EDLLGAGGYGAARLGHGSLVLHPLRTALPWPPWRFLEAGFGGLGSSLDSSLARSPWAVPPSGRSAPPLRPPSGRKGRPLPSVPRRFLGPLGSFPLPSGMASNRARSCPGFGRSVARMGACRWRATCSLAETRRKRSRSPSALGEAFCS